MMCKALEQSSGKFVMIDHHQDPSDFADMVFSEPNICSTAQLIFDFIEDMAWKDLLNIDIAKCIYTGMVTDTGSFRFSSVDARTHEIAAALINLGLDQADIHQKLFDNNKASRLKLLGYCLSEKLEVLPEYHTAIMSLSIEELDKFNFEKSISLNFIGNLVPIPNALEIGTSILGLLI